MMKKALSIIIFVIIFISCSNQLNSQIDDPYKELATDSQRNWCFGAIDELDVFSETFFKDMSVETQQILIHSRTIFDPSLYLLGGPLNLEELKTGLEDKTPSSLRKCKIWADMVDID